MVWLISGSFRIRTAARANSRAGMAGVPSRVLVGVYVVGDTRLCSHIHMVAYRDVAGYTYLSSHHAVTAYFG